MKDFLTVEDLMIESRQSRRICVLGVASDDFELALDRLGKALGFDANRPDKELRESTDNLWALKDNFFLLIECKNQVSVDRKEINKDETRPNEQFVCVVSRIRYPGSKSSNLMIIWTKTLGTGAGFTEEVRIMRNKKLDSLVKNTKDFF